MKKTVIFAASLCCGAAAAQDSAAPATVIITAGQSNADGRVANDELPQYIITNGYKHCKWCYGSGGSVRTDGFEAFWPRTANERHPERYAFDAITYYWLDQSADSDFYVIKWTLGGTAIDTACTSTSGKYWCADSAWIASTSSTLTGGKSLLLSFTEEISACIDGYLSALPNGYRVKAFLWHQGESDRHAGARYYDNLKAVVAYVRRFLVEKTGDDSYKHLPFICGTVARSNKQYSSDVEDAMHRLADEDADVYVIDMADAELQADRLHFTAEGAERLGVAVYDTLVGIGIAEPRP